MKTYLVTWEVQTTQGNCVEWDCWEGETAAEVLENVRRVRDWEVRHGLKRRLNIKVRKARYQF